MLKYEDLCNDYNLALAKLWTWLKVELVFPDLNPRIAVETKTANRYPSAFFAFPTDLLNYIEGKYGFQMNVPDQVSIWSNAREMIVKSINMYRRAKYVFKNPQKGDYDSTYRP